MLERLIGRPRLIDESTPHRLATVRVAEVDLSVVEFDTYPNFSHNADIAMAREPRLHMGAELGMFCGWDNWLDCVRWERAYRHTLQECALDALGTDDPSARELSVYRTYMYAIHQQELIGRGLNMQARRINVARDIASRVAKTVPLKMQEIKQSLMIHRNPTIITTPNNILPGQLFARGSDN